MDSSSAWLLLVRVVDREAVDETARFLGVEPIMVEGPHDVMLSENEAETCDLVGGWLKTGT